LAVRDDGCGIPAEDHDRIFQPFFTTKSIGRGTGLGLAITYGIVKMHHGSIWFESAPGEGATFFIELPASQARQTRSMTS
jgi:signal transduction histidine kinase